MSGVCADPTSLARMRTVFRYVLVFWLFGWFLKAAFFVPYLFQGVYQIQVVNDFFPGFFQSNLISALSYILPIITAYCFFSEDTAVFRLSAGILILASAILCWHQNTYNDATFITSFWVAVWLFWFSSPEGQKDTTGRHAVVLGSCLVGMIFLAGFVGKQTPEYWSGEVIGKIFMEQRGASPLENFLAPWGENKTFILSIAAKVIIVVEGVLALNLVIYSRRFWLMSACLLPALILFSTWRILSVILCLIGLLLALIKIKNHDIQA